MSLGGGFSLAMNYAVAGADSVVSDNSLTIKSNSNVHTYHYVSVSMYILITCLNSHI